MCGGGGIGFTPSIHDNLKYDQNVLKDELTPMQWKDRKIFQSTSIYHKLNKIILNTLSTTILDISLKTYSNKSTLCVLLSFQNYLNNQKFKLKDNT